MKKLYTNLHMNNDWGYRYLTKSRKVGQDDQLLFKTGMAVKVKYPSGQTQTVTIRMKRFCDTVSDMGKSYPVEYDLPYFKADFRGLEIEIPLHDVEVLISDLPLTVKAAQAELYQYGQPGQSYTAKVKK